MSLKRKFIVLYLLVGLEGVLFIEFQNVFILGRSWSYVLKYNLPFVLGQNAVFIVAYYLFTVRQLKDVLRLERDGIATLNPSEREVLFKKLVRFPFVLFRFSIVFMVGLAVAFHIYALNFVSHIDGKVLVNVLISFLREQSLGLLLTLTIIAALSKMLRPFILALHQPYIERIHVSLAKKILLVFFSILFIFISDIMWIFFKSDGTIQDILIKIGITIVVLVCLSVLFIRLTIMDSIAHIQDVAKYVATTSKSDRESIHFNIPVTSTDEIAYLVGNFNTLQGKVRELYRELDEELMLAYTVQNHLLPTTYHNFGAIKVQGLAIPMKEVGGDFFDIIKINDKKIGILIGDVAGKGLPAALFTSVMIGLSKGKMNHEASSPAELLETFNKLLFPMLSEGMYVTAGIAFIDLEDHTLTYASAGHVSPVVRSKSKTYLLEHSSLPLGIDEDEKYSETSISLEDVETIVFYTDGIVEQRNERNEMFGFKRLCSLVDYSEIKDASLLMQSITDFSNGTKRMDDMTIVYLKNNVL
ncbi:PP2C family protein-serine/threonine phosphatase [Bacillus sp. Marseille-P3661]|uniref:PP2C family protein-serine/threonine phosphatase n=1 Tax=Bacillus sp. Marseille-P3661 TaxID=1936234 RepID=UPI000C82401D|nr:PP2C family protein-serine/threonine phosphatase [Bacillus sp. Marseille-P3661]